MIKLSRVKNVIIHDEGNFKMATMDTIVTILNDNLDIPAEKVTEDATFESLGIDSLDMAELTCTIEEELDIDFGEPEGLTTVGELVTYIDSL